ncbi:cadmium resistance transporter [Sporomusa termitida]|uniref:Cad: cadmium resistance transporter family protein n=1 Tax=Sporomusa termitida TaxID=2377 RepID=A0A517DPC9_9FIRM|nr:cadmium resistance transporter [Sporomusa termitida]QDR79219.1 cad: cadmium resistance transporter family protein [Sporomusa termitida]
MESAIVTAFVAFVSTNIDDIFVLMLFYSQIGGQLKKCHIIAGQYLGITILLIVSVLGSLGLNIVPPQYTGLLGMIPILLGIKQWSGYRQEKKAAANSTKGSKAEVQSETGSDPIAEHFMFDNAANETEHVMDDRPEIEAQVPKKTKIKAALSKLINPAVLNVSLVTVANGADNIGIYIPLFTRLSTVELIITIIIFLLLIAVWCFIGEQLTNFPGIKDTIQKYKNLVVPVVFIGIGIFILVESGALSFLTLNLLK